MLFPKTAFLFTMGLLIMSFESADKEEELDVADAIANAVNILTIERVSITESAT